MRIQDKEKILSSSDWFRSDEILTLKKICKFYFSLQLVGEGKTVTDKMIRLLSERQNPVNDFKLQHAILGALRNFAVTAQVRQILLDKGKVAIIN